MGMELVCPSGSKNESVQLGTGRKNNIPSPRDGDDDIAWLLGTLAAGGRRERACADVRADNFESPAVALEAVKEATVLDRAAGKLADALDFFVAGDFEAFFGKGVLHCTHFLHAFPFAAPQILPSDKTA
jgi:hypothetical protein